MVCSHTLEDLRDPLWVCRELIRVAKAGYIEVPSRLFETIIGMERPGQAGLSHHRWLVDVDGTHISFLQEVSRMIHADWRFPPTAPPEEPCVERRHVELPWWRDSFASGA